jgi:hypothetical protein
VGGTKPFSQGAGAKQWIHYNFINGTERTIMALMPEYNLTMQGRFCAFTTIRSFPKVLFCISTVTSDHVRRNNNNNIINNNGAAKMKRQIEKILPSV